MSSPERELLIKIAETVIELAQSKGHSIIDVVDKTNKLKEITEAVKELQSADRWLRSD